MAEQTAKLRRRSFQVPASPSARYPSCRARTARRLLRVCAAATLAAASVRGGHAADPQPYRVTIAPTGEAKIDTTVHDASTLISLRESAPVGPFALIARARFDAGRFSAAMQSQGYYAGQVDTTIAGRPLDDLGLADVLDATPDQTEVPVDVKLTLGPRFQIGQVRLNGDVPPEARVAFGLKPGDPAVAADIVAAKDRLETALLDSGYALAKVDMPAASLHPDAHTLDVALNVAPGPRLEIGPIAVTGLERVNESFVRRRLLLHAGEPFDPRTIEKARQDLASEGVFASVRITPATVPGPDGRLPVTVAVTERPLRVVNVGAAFSTDQGASVNLSWSHRNLFGNAEQLTLSAAATQIGGSASKQPGYNVGATLAFPDFRHRDQTLTLNVAAIKEYLTAYNRTAYTAGASVSRKIDDELTVSLGLTGEQAKIRQEGVTRDYTLLQLPIGATIDTTHDLFNPTHGYKLQATITPTESIRSPQATFVIAQVTASTYIDLEAPGRGVLAIRGLVGSVAGANTFQIPPDQRFYGGGSGTIRGYKFQSVGPLFPSGHPIGGTAIDAINVEFRQRFGESYGAVAFVDAGQVGTGSKPFTGPLRTGVGVGARYYTSIGPIRLDIAVPIQRQRKSDLLEAYIGIGQAF